MSLSGAVMGRSSIIARFLQRCPTAAIQMQQGTGFEAAGGTLLQQSGLAFSQLRPITSQTSPSKLSEVMKLDELAGKSPQEVADIWIQYHLDTGNKGRTGSVMSREDWDVYQERAKKSPLFVLPLAKPGGGFLSLITNMQLPFALVTTLEEYRRYGAGAPAAVQVTHYTELLDSSGLVLVRGDCTNEKLVNPAEARTVLELLRALYTDGKDYKMVLDFNHNPQAFDFNKLLSKLGLGPDGKKLSGSEAGAGAAGSQGAAASGQQLAGKS